MKWHSGVITDSLLHYIRVRFIFWKDVFEKGNPQRQRVSGFVFDYHSWRSFFILIYSSLLISPLAYLFFSISNGVSCFNSVEVRLLLRFWIALKIHISIAIRRTVQKIIMRNPPPHHMWSNPHILRFISWAGIDAKMKPECKRLSYQKMRDFEK